MNRDNVEPFDKEGGVMKGWRKVGPEEFRRVVRLRDVTCEVDGDYPYRFTFKGTDRALKGMFERGIVGTGIMTTFYLPIETGE